METIDQLLKILDAHNESEYMIFSIPNPNYMTTAFTFSQGIQEPSHIRLEVRNPFYKSTMVKEMK